MDQPIKTNAGSMQLTDAATHASESRRPAIQFLHISFLGFLLLDWITWGLFRYYWLYSNWKAIKKAEKSNISPFWRAVFGIFFVGKLFSYMAGAAKEQGYTKTLRSSVYANTYIILVCLGKLLLLVWSLAITSLADETSKGLVYMFNWMWITVTDLTCWPIQRAINFYNTEQEKNQQLKLDNQVYSPVTPYFQASPTRLLLLNILTLRLYTVYWFYKNWQTVKKHTSRPILPFWRGVFFFFFIPSLFKNIATVATSKGYPLIWYRLLSVLYICSLFMLAMSYSPLQQYGVIPPVAALMLIPCIGAVLDTIFLWPFQQAIQFYNLASMSAHQPRLGLTKGEIKLAIVGIILWGYLLFTLFK